MATSNINVRVDTKLKQSAESLFDDLGLSMSSAITMFLKSAVRYNGIPFEVIRFNLNEETRNALSEYNKMKTDPNSYKRYESFDSVLDEVLS